MLNKICMEGEARLCLYQDFSLFSKFIYFYTLNSNDVIIFENGDCNTLTLWRAGFGQTSQREAWRFFFSNQEYIIKKNIYMFLMTFNQTNRLDIFINIHKYIKFTWNTTTVIFHRLKTKFSIWENFVQQLVDKEKTFNCKTWSNNRNYL